MDNKRPTFRLYILGYLGEYQQPLITLAEYKESRAVERINLDEALVTRLSKQIRETHASIEAVGPPIEEATLKDLGGQLCDLIVQKTVRRLFDQATGQRKNLLPLELFTEDPAIASWPWEYLYDKGTEKFLTEEFHPISRGIYTLLTPPPLKPIKKKVRILMVIGVLPDSNNSGAGEIKWIEEVFKSHLATDSVAITVIRGVDPAELDAELQKNSYDVLHFFGHGRFDGKRKEGYLKFEKSGGKAFHFYANKFAQLLINKNLRLVFLNACESGRMAQNEDPSRSSIAAAILSRGIPAVVATQFQIPEISAHYLSSKIYNGLVMGKPLVEAIQDGRRAMNYAPDSKCFDWGIPVLYTSDPDLVLFPLHKSKSKSKWISPYNKASKTGNFIEALSSPPSPHSPSFTVERTIIPGNKAKAKVSVALIDFDAKVGFLPDLIQAANHAQHYYHFQVCYLPLPSGAIKADLSEENEEASSPQFYLPAVEDYFKNLPQHLSVSKVCCLTQWWIAGKTKKGKLFQEYRASALNSSEDVFVMSTKKLREYASMASVTYAKATLYICLSMIVATDANLKGQGLKIHNETAGCLFDNCKNQDDLVIGLKKMSLDHEDCLKILRKNEEQLAAINALLAVQVDSDGA